MVRRFAVYGGQGVLDVVKGLGLQVILQMNVSGQGFDMPNKEELGYYDYWLTKETWPAWRAINLVVYYIKLRRSWETYEQYEKISENMYNEISKRLNALEGTNVFINRVILHDIDKFRNWIPKEIDMNESEVDPEWFIQWIYSCGYPIPYEFKVFIGVEEKVEQPNQKLQERIDREVVQGIARTLWDEYPDMTIEHMQDHKAVQIYGSGRVCCADSTLRRWLGEVDPRTEKRGRKKKLAVSE